MFGCPVTLRRWNLMNMTRPFHCVADSELPERCSQINDLFESLPFDYLAATCDKVAHRRQYGESLVNQFLPTDLYQMAFIFVVERFIAFLEEDDANGEIHIERRGRKEDASLARVFATLLTDGTEYYKEWRFGDRLVPSLRWFTKDDRKAGLQIADWYNWALSRKMRGDAGVAREFEFLKIRFWRGKNAGNPGQVGLKTWPRPVGRNWLNCPLAAEQ